MTYTEIRAAIAASITDQAALIELLTAENVQTVAECAPGIGVPTAYVQGSMESAFFAGLLVARGMYDPKNSAKTVDEVLSWYAPANIYAAQIYARLVDALPLIGFSLNDYLDGIDSQANETAPLPC